MDTLTFGNFLRERRTSQSMTQAELADKLHVTAKAVSRWERGVGFPDIQTLEPLAQALDVSLLELMQSRMIPEETIPREEASAAVADTLLIAGGRKKGTLLAVTYFCILFILVSTALLTFALWHFVESPWIRAFGMMAIFLLNHLCVNGINGLLQRVSALPKRPSRRQLIRWGLTAASILSFLASFPVRELVGISQGNLLRFLFVILFCVRDWGFPKETPPLSKE